MLKNGTIESANWKRTHTRGLEPYLQLVIVLDIPYYLKDREVRKVFKAISLLVPPTPWSLTPMGQLERAIGVKIELSQPPKIKLDQPIPELVGKRLSVDIQEVVFQEQVRLYVREMLPEVNE